MRFIQHSIGRAFIALFFLCFSSFSLAVDVQVSQLVDTPDPAVRAGELTYTTSVLNGANDTANNVVLTLPLPATTSFVSVDNGACTHDGGTPGTVTCNLGNMTGDGLGNPVTTINTVIRTSASTGNTISVTATATTSSSDTDSSNNSETQNTTIDDSADLRASIVDVADPVTAGGSIAYQITIDNLGPNDASSITVTNTLPADVTFSNASGSGWSCSNSGQTVTCTRASLTNGATAPVITINGTVTGAVTGTITNAVSVSASTGDPDSNNNTVTEDTTVSSGTDLSITKAVSPSPVIGGQTASFTLQPRNNGPFDASNAVVTDTLPAGFTYTGYSVTGSGSWTCSEAGGTVTCNLANFTVGTTENILINTTAPASGTFSNTASISSSTTDPNSANDSGSVNNVNIVPDGADLSISKSKSPNPVAQGSPITSTIGVSNLGPQSTSGTITVTDDLAGETFVSSSGTNWSCGASGSAPNETVTCTYSGSALTAGASTANLTITTTATNAGTLTNTASVSDAGGTTDGVLSNNSTSASVTSTAQIADLSLTKSADAGGDSTLTVAENTITYTLTLTNNGPDALSDPANGSVDNAIVISDSMPRYISGVTNATPNTTAIAVTSSNPKFTCSAGSTVTCRLNDGATFNNGEVEVFTITATRPFSNGTTHNNTASVSSSVLGDDNPSNNTSNTTTITVDPIADVQMTSKVITPDPVQAGTNATYVLSFRNNGPSTAANVTVQDIFSPPVGRDYTVLSITPSNGASCDPFETSGANTLDCNFGSMGRNATRTVTLVVRPEWDVGNNTWSMNNTATVSTTTDQGTNPSTDSQTATLNVGQADADMLVNNIDVADPVGFTPTPGAFPGSLDNIIVYKVDMTNRGPSLATGVSLQYDVTPKSGKQLTFLCDDSGSSSCATGTSTCNNLGSSITGPASLTLTCPQSDMLSSTTATRYLFFQVDSAPDSTGDTHNTLATISSNEDDSLVSNDTESESTSVRVRVDLGVTKTASQASVNLNEPFDWDLVVFNNGPGDSADSMLSDTLPSGMELTAAPTTSQGTCTGSAGATSFTCTLGTVVARATSGIADASDVSITVPVRVTAYPGGGTISNTASVTTFGVDSNSSNNSDTDTVTVVKSSLAGVVYEDNNDNGSQDSGENGINSVSLNLSGTDLYGNTVNQSASTDSSGAYLFDDLAPSDGTGYTITQTHPSGYVDGLENAAGSLVPNSKATDLISSISLPANTNASGYLFGELGGSSTVGLISGFVYNDGSDDGTRDPENPGIENVTITLSGTDGVGNPVNLTTTTDSNGAYSFTNLQPGTYTLTETQPAGYRDNIDSIGDLNGNPVGTVSNDVLSGIILPAGGVATEYNFADSNTAVSGYVYVDNNNDGVMDSGEAGISGVSLTLTGTDTNSNPVSMTVSTDSTGYYLFTGMLASDSTGYTVSESQPTAWADGIDSVGNAGGDASANDLISRIEIGPSTFASNYNFGELGASLSGYVYNDNGDDGDKDISDPGIPDVTLTLTGTDLNGNPVNQAITTRENGYYLFENVPLPDATGFTITESQPSGVNDGKENTTNVISGIQISTPGAEETGFDFGEIVPAIQTASVSGRVYDRDGLERSQHPDWVVHLYRNGLLVASTMTDAQGNYRLEGMAPGSGYAIHFLHPESGAVFGVLDNLTLVANTELPDQDFPIDPSGVVYDSVSRLPVPDAIVTFNGPPGFNASTDLIGGSANQSQTVGADGMYKFLLNPTAPAGEYSLSVTAPSGYLPPTSTNIPDPCSGPLLVGATPAPANIQPQETAPQAGTTFHDPAACPGFATAGTQYYLSFSLSSSSADVINNHIPLDPDDVLTGLTVIKSTPKVNVTRGDLVPYSILVTNNLSTPVTNIQIRDQIPPGFKYVAQSAVVDGLSEEPVVDNRVLTFTAQDYAVGESHEVKLLLVVGAGVGEGEYVNQAWGINAQTGATVTGIATATVRVIPDPTFDCSDLIGKVFDDKNANGYQDEGEPGLPAVRVATVRGLLITSDAQGRFHIPCAAVPNEMHGSNFILKLDEASLPSGYRVTTENPRVIRLTRGKLAKLNFGATIHRIVRVDLNAKAFNEAEDQLSPAFEKHLETLFHTLKQAPSILRLSYLTQGEDHKLVRNRLKHFQDALQERWEACDCSYELIIETQTKQEDHTTGGSIANGRAK